MLNFSWLALKLYFNEQYLSVWATAASCLILDTFPFILISWNQTSDTWQNGGNQILGDGLIAFPKTHNDSTSQMVFFKGQRVIDVALDKPVEMETDVEDPKLHVWSCDVTRERWQHSYFGCFCTVAGTGDTSLVYNSDCKLFNGSNSLVWRQKKTLNWILNMVYLKGT